MLLAKIRTRAARLASSERRLCSLPDNISYEKKDTFEQSLQRVRDYSSFQNDSDNEQAPVRVQFAMTIFQIGALRFRCKVGQCSPGNFDMSKGAVHKLTLRVRGALQGRLKDFVTWPSPAGPVQLKADLKEMKGLPFDECAGVVDGRPRCRRSKTASLGRLRLFTIAKSVTR